MPTSVCTGLTPFNFIRKHFLQICLWDVESMSTCMSRVRNLAALIHLGLEAGPLCPLSNQGSPEALLKLQMAPHAYTLNVLKTPRKRGPDMPVWVKPKSHIRKEYGPRFPPSPHISYTMDCPAVLKGRDAASGCYVQWVGQLLPPWIVRCFLCTQLLQFLIHWASVGDHDTLQSKCSTATFRTHCIYRAENVLTHYSGRVTQICVFNTVKLGTSASSP